MADEDFNIKVVTTADTSGLKQTSAELVNLEKQAKAAGITPDIAAQLAEAGARFDPVKKAFVSITEEAGKAGEAIKAISGGVGLAGLVPSAGVGAFAGLSGAVKEAAESSGHMALNLGKARQEAIILAREFATGIPTVRTLSSLLGSLGIPIAIAATAGIALYKAITVSGEAAKKAAEEHAKLQDELDENVRSYEKIRSVAQWDEENFKIEDQIGKIQRKIALTTNGQELDALKSELAQYENQKLALGALSQEGIKRAKIEEAVKKEIKDETEAVKELAVAYGAVRKAAEETAATQKKIRDLKRDEAEDIAAEKRRKGEITSAQELADKETAREKAASANHAAEQNALDSRKKSLQDEASQFKDKSDRENKILEGMEQESVQREKLKNDAKTAEDDVRKAVEKTREARETERKLQGPTGREFPELARQAEEDRKRAEAEEKAARARATEVGAAAKRPGERPGEFEENLEKQRAKAKEFDDERRRSQRELAKETPEIDEKKKANDEIYNETEKRERARSERAISNAQKERDERLADEKARQQIEADKAAGFDLTAAREKAQLDQRTKDRELIKEGLTQQEAAGIAAGDRAAADAEITRKAQEEARKAQELRGRAAEEDIRSGKAAIEGRQDESIRAAQEAEDARKKAADIERDLSQVRPPIPEVERKLPPEAEIPPEERKPPLPLPERPKIERPPEQFGKEFSTQQIENWLQKLYQLWQ